jgi:DNA-directed RNA polymerase specialized sigma24 family protein
MQSKNKAIEIMARHHNEFIKMAKAIAGNNFKVRNYAEDYVQDAYIRLARFDDLYDKVISDKGKFSKGYMFFTLRSIIINDIKRVRTPKFSFIGDEYDMEEKFMLEDKGVDKDVLLNSAIEDLMHEVVKTKVHWFDAQLFTTYIQEGISFRELAARTGLGIQTIYLSIKRVKLAIAEHLHEDYQDFKNRELNLIS